MRTRAKLAVGAFGGCAAILMLIYGWWLGQQVDKLRAQNQDLTNSLAQAKQILTMEIARAERVEAATLRLEAQDAQRKQQIQQFELRLGELSEEYDSILSVVIPPELVHGLYSFERDNGEQHDEDTSTLVDTD